MSQFSEVQSIPEPPRQEACLLLSPTGMLDTAKQDESQPAKRRVGRMKEGVNSALLTTVFAVTATQLLGVIRDDHALDDATRFQWNLLNFTSYCAILVNTIATAASVFLHHPPGGIAFEEARQHMPVPGEVQSRRRELQRIASQCTTHVVLGMMFIVSQALAYMWVREDLWMNSGPA
ncbi:hypothetical protein DFH09DRAFT_1188663 [Mycena vulgaris]|nr:hypothetical protein DFH09DRAFT_1188663 [Mycena vulgaris]